MKKFYKLKLINIIYVLLLFSLHSCTYNNQFIVYPNENVNINEEYISGNFKLYFNVDDIKNEYDIIAVIGTNTYYYGQFFFDNVFTVLPLRLYICRATCESTGKLY